MQYLLSDQVYVDATVPPTKTVCLWLGVSDAFTFEMKMEMVNQGPGAHEKIRPLMGLIYHYNDISSKLGPPKENSLNS